MKKILLLIALMILVASGCNQELIDERDESFKITEATVSYEIENDENLIQVTNGQRKMLVENIQEFLGSDDAVGGWHVFSSFDNTIILRGIGGGAGLVALYKISLQPLQAESIHNRPPGIMVKSEFLSPSGRYLLYPTTRNYSGNELRKIWVCDFLKDTEILVLELPEEESLTEGFEVVNYQPIIVEKFTIEWEDNNKIRYNVFSAEQELVELKLSDIGEAGSHGPLRTLLETRSLDIQQFIE